MRENSELLRAVESVLLERRTDAQLTAESRQAALCREVPGYAAAAEAVKREGIRLGRIAVTEGVRSAAYRETEERLQSLRKERERILHEAGFPPDYLENVYFCPQCRDTGVRRTENGPVRCDCFMELYTSLLREDSNLTQFEGFDSFDLSYYDGKPGDVAADGDTLAGRNPDTEPETPRARAERVLKTARAFVEGFGNGGTGNLLLIGKTGVGKTHLCRCIACELLAKGIPVLYVSASELFSLLTYYGQDPELNERRSALEKAVYSVDLLILDDLGAEKQSDARYSILLDLLNRRNETDKRTVISSNLTPRKLQSDYDERIFSRLVSFEICELLGDDIRILKKTRA